MFVVSVPLPACGYSDEGVVAMAVLERVTDPDTPEGQPIGITMVVDVEVVVVVEEVEDNAVVEVEEVVEVVDVEDVEDVAAPHVSNGKAPLSPHVPVLTAGHPGGQL